MHHNWLKTGWVKSFEDLSGIIRDQGHNLTGTDPGFVNAAIQNFKLTSASACIDAGTDLPPKTPGHPVQQEYVKHQQTRLRPSDQKRDLGAYEKMD